MPMVLISSTQSEGPKLASHIQQLHEDGQLLGRWYVWSLVVMALTLFVILLTYPRMLLAFAD